MPGRRRAPVLLALAALAVCAGALAGPKRHRVVIESLQYAPQHIEVRQGDSIVWSNRDFFPHTVTAEDRSFDSGEIASQRSWRFVARRKGVFPYVCTLHPTMKGRLVVK